MDLMNLLFIVTQFSAFLLALTIHEAAHALAAYKLGDPTAKMEGRLSLNPKVHIDPVGTLLIPIVAALTHIPVIGWAKPVPVNPYNLRDPKLDHAFIAGAGPLSNLIQAVFYTIILWLMEPMAAPLYATLMGAPALSFFSWFQVIIYMICLAGVMVNLLLAVFNMLPIPPLDGGWILGGLLPERFAVMLRSLGSMGFIIIMMLMYTGILWKIIGPILRSYFITFLPDGSIMIYNAIIG